MTKIKFIDARFADPDENEFALKRRFEWHLRKLRALQDGVSPKVPGDFEDELRWNEDLIAVPLSEKNRNKVLRRARRVMGARSRRSVAVRIWSASSASTVPMRSPPPFMPKCLGWRRPLTSSGKRCAARCGRVSSGSGCRPCCSTARRGSARACGHASSGAISGCRAVASRGRQSRPPSS